MASNRMTFAGRPAASFGYLAGFVSGDGLRLRYHEWRPSSVSRSSRATHDAPPIVLLHGITESGLAWRPVAEKLAMRRRVIALDARGHGESGWSADEAYAPDAHFADLTCALAALDVERCLLAGFSMGGAVATICAAARPDLVQRLVIVDAYPAPELSPGSRRVAEWLAAALDYAGWLPAGFDPAIARRMRDDLAAGTARRLDLWPLWEALSVPATIVRGALSDVLTAEAAAEMLRRQPCARLLTLRGVGHQIPSQRPWALARAIAEDD
ncbi:MAG TPA: alpha/beta fold hydrolase [Dehalococcoidia bacterium]|nr:alpha/beta fold hydrolase [Dehalococcoidia bacterium]